MTSKLRFPLLENESQTIPFQKVFLFHDTKRKTHLKATIDSKLEENTFWYEEKIDTKVANPGPSRSYSFEHIHEKLP